MEEIRINGISFNRINGNVSGFRYFIAHQSKLIYIKTFFLSSQFIEYFPVDVPDNQSTRPPAQISIEALLERATLNDGEINKERDIMRAAKNNVDETSWEYRTRWSKIFDGLDMKVLVEGFQRPKGDAFLEAVWESVMRVLRKRCMRGVEDCNERGWRTLLFWLASIDATRPSQTPFSHVFDAGTLNDYSQAWAGLIMLCLRRLEMPPDHHVLLKADAVTALEWIRIVWQRVEEGIGFEENDLDDAILAFSAQLIMHEEWKGITAVEYYCGLMGYRQKTRTLATPDIYTPKLAAMQWCMRVILLEWTLPVGERNDFPHDNGETPLDKFRKIHGKWLVEGQTTPFHHVHTLMNYGMNIAKSMPGKDHIYIPPDKQILYYDGQPLRIAMWIVCVHKLIEELERLTCLLMHISELPLIDLYFIDNPRMTDIGEYFGIKQEGGKRGARDRMLRKLEAKGELHIWINDDGTYNIEAILTYERLVDEWLQVCSVVIVFTCGMAGRGYEMLSIRYCNARISKRNIRVRDGQMMIYPYTVPVGASNRRAHHVKKISRD